MSRWISWLRPEGWPSLTSRRMRSADDPGSMEYSAVTQPLPRPRIQRGTSSSMDAVHSTRVCPKLTRHDPAAISVKSRSNVMGRRSSGARPSSLIATHGNAAMPSAPQAQMCHARPDGHDPRLATTPEPRSVAGAEGE